MVEGTAVHTPELLLPPTTLAGILLTIVAATS